MKFCPTCGETKPLDDFNNNRAARDGKVHYCKPCWYKYIKERRKPGGVGYEKELAYQRQYRDKHKTKRGEYTKRWEVKNIEKVAAHRAVKNALKRGDITREPCEVCGDTKSDGHHEDYSKQLCVRWLCRRHHKQAHAN